MVPGELRAIDLFGNIYALLVENNTIITNYDE